jgi:uncharacterized protein YndB with AHSA1/START domain
MTSSMADPMTNTDRIEKKVFLRAPVSRVWQALADSKQFSEWFRTSIDEPFAAGKTVTATFVKAGAEGMKMEMVIERIEPQRYFSYRWHPYAIDPKTDYSKEPMTLVEFTLEEAEGGTQLTIVESGFDRIPAARRAEAFRMNEGGWTAQSKRIAEYVEK